MVILKGDQEYAFKEVNECQAGYILLISVLFVVSVSIEMSNLFYFLILNKFSLLNLIVHYFT